MPDAVVPTHKIRMHHEHADPGGGGVNVARVVHELGGDVLAVIAAGGASGRVLEEMLDEVGVPRRSVLIQGRTRVSLNVLDMRSGLEYRFVPEGPTLSEAECARVPGCRRGDRGRLGDRQRQPAERRAGGCLCPDGADRRAARGQRFVLDTSGAALKAALEQGGSELVKPSLSELEHLVGCELKDPAAQDAEAMALVRRGAAGWSR